MSKLLQIAWKDALLRFSSRSELLFFLILPIVFTFILGGARFGPPDGIRTLVVDRDGSPASADLIADLDALETLRVEAQAEDAALAEFEAGDSAALLTIPAGYGAALTTGAPVALELRVLPGSTDALGVQRSIAAVVGNLARPAAVAAQAVIIAEQIAPFADDAERASYYAQSVTAADAAFAERPTALVRQQAPALPTYDAAAHQSIGQLITWVFIPLLGTAALFAYERNGGTLRRLLTTPTQKATLLLGVISGQLVMALIQMTLLIGFGALVLGVAWGRDPLALALVLVAFGLASVALGTMLGTFVKTESQASNLAIMLGMTMALLGGCWFPLELFPPAARTLAALLPTRWAMQGLIDLTVRGVGLGDILPETGVLLAFAAVFFAIGVWRFRFE